MPDEIKEESVEVEEVDVAEPTAFATDGLLPEEIEMAGEHGLIEEEKVEDDKHEEQPEVKTEDSEGEVEEPHPTFEDVEKDEKKLEKYNRNEQALYWKFKANNRKRQSAQKETEEYKTKLELEQIKESAAKTRLKKITEALKGEVTIEALQEIIGVETEEKVDVNTEVDKKLQEQEKSVKERTERIETLEELGKSRYEDFEELTKLANEVIETKPRYKKHLAEAFDDKDFDEDELIDMVVDYAKLNPNFGKQSEEKPEKKEESKEVTRAIKNSKKKVSSASVGRGGGSRTISYSDLTIEDAAKLSYIEYNKLPETVRKRLLMG